MENHYEDELVRLEIVDDILIGEYKPLKVDLKIAKRITEARVSFTKTKVYPVLVDFRKVNETNKEARQFFTTEAASQGLTAMAILIDSPVGRMLGAFFMAIYKTTYPIKIFTDKNKAVSWLQTIKKKDLLNARA